MNHTPKQTNTNNNDSEANNGDFLLVFLLEVALERTLKILAHVERNSLNLAAQEEGNVSASCGP